MAQENYPNIFLFRLYKTFFNVLEYLYPINLLAQINDSNICFGNIIINWLSAKYNEHEFLSLDRYKYCILPDFVYYQNSPLTNKEKYLKFYFENDFSEYLYENENGIIFLHNSWTPKEYKNMGEEEFLKLDCTIAKVLKRYNKGS